MRIGSGSYDVRRCEAMSSQTTSTSTTTTTSGHSTIRCSVAFLDGTIQTFDIDRHAVGSVLLDKVLAHVEIVERDYFGLQFVAVVDDAQQKKWLDPQKSVRKQMICPPYHLMFRVKFYVNEPSKLREEYTRYHYFLQVRLDIADGRLLCSDGSMALLASYAVQSDLGDYNADEHLSGYTDSIVFAPRQSNEFCAKVAELHRLHVGQSPAEAEYNFLDHAKRLEMYGVDVYEARDGTGLPIGIGVNCFGVKIFHDGIKINEFSWSQIMKISFKKKQFFLQIKYDEHQQDTVLIFNVCTPASCKQLWKCCIEQHTFFRLKAPPMAPPKKLFSVGSKFRYSGRTEYQTMEELKHRRPLFQRSFNRSASKTSFSRSLATSSIDSSQTPTTASPDVPSTSRFSGRILARRLIAESCELGGYSSDGALSPRHLRQTDSESSAPSLRRRHGKETTFGVSEEESADERSWTPNMQACTSSAVPPTVHHRPSTGPSSLTSTRKSAPTAYSNGYGGYGSAGPATSNLHYINGNGTISRATSRGASPRVSTATTHTASPRNSVASYSSYASAGLGGSPPRSRRSPQSQKSNSPVGEDSLVCVKMRPDLHGRFGFNVKGGADQNYPVIVSRVAPGSSADKCQPRLNEGDQVLFINGRDVSTMSHDQVVSFIRSARQSPTGGELVLTIKPNVYRLGEDIEEPEGVPEPARVADSVPRSDKLSQSLRLLSDALSTGKVVSQFEQLYRKKPGLSMNDCRLSANINKNRYRDVCPYDATRVFLNSSSSGDYINANFVNMEIPSSGIVNRYIACQGPLAHTSGDFWHMVWEQLCTTIVMLTTTTERGRVKCHQYWPRLYESQEYGRLTIRCIKERTTSNCSYREFALRDRASGDERRVSQMQYTAWPDHGVPDDPKHFISFVDEVRKARAGSVEPIVVHCSAGIGRTGVLILMETAACLVEANEPVYPLDIVRTMRDQRAMLIQTPGQYTFVCESILRAYDDGVIKPLAEYQKGRLS